MGLLFDNKIPASSVHTLIIIPPFIARVELWSINTSLNIDVPFYYLPPSLRNSNRSPPVSVL